jgi:hypothetical protein
MIMAEREPHSSALSHLDFGVVIPAQAGIQCPSVVSRLRGNDRKPCPGFEMRSNW